MNITQVKKVNFEYRKHTNQRIMKIKKCYMEIFEYLVKHRIDYTKNNNGVFFYLTAISQNTAYDLDQIITKHEYHWLLGMHMSRTVL